MEKMGFMEAGDLTPASISTPLHLSEWIAAGTALGCPIQRKL
jgi:hypothetical protein